MQKQHIRDSAVFLTGGSRGLGRALALELGRAGARLVLMAREPEPLEAVVAEIRAEGGEAHALPADIGDVARATEIAGRAAALVGGLDVAIHNASSLGPVPMPPLLDTPPRDLARVFEVNLFGPFAVTRAIAGSMLVRGGGTVVNISSDAAVGAYPQWGAYGASKAALDHMTRTWAAEWEGTPVRFFSVDPGEMDTRMHADAIPDADPATLARPADVARAILAMLGDATRAPSGARLVASAWEVAR